MSTREKLKNYLSKILKTTTEQEDVKEGIYEFLKDYHETSLTFLKEFLEEVNINESVENIIKNIERELSRRKSVSEELINELKKKYLNQYIRYNYKDGLGSYIVTKVIDINKTNKDYCDLYYSVSVSNVDGDYTINSYKSASIKIYSDLEQEKIEVITEEEYKDEFNKAIEYYKSLDK